MPSRNGPAGKGENLKKSGRISVGERYISRIETVAVIIQATGQSWRPIQIGFSFEDSAAIHDIGPVHKFRQIQLALGLLSFLRSGSWPANPRGNTRLGSKG